MKNEYVLVSLTQLSILRELLIDPDRQRSNSSNQYALVIQAKASILKCDDCICWKTTIVTLRASKITDHKARKPILTEQVARLLNNVAITLYEDVVG